MKKRFSEEQIIGFLQQAEAGIPVKELCRQYGFSDGSFYNWRAKFGGMSVLEPALELVSGQPLLLDKLPIAICNSDLEYTLGQIHCNGSSMHFGLLSSKPDPHPHEHRRRLFRAKKTGESIPSVNTDRPQATLAGSLRASRSGGRLPSRYGSGMTRAFLFALLLLVTHCSYATAQIPELIELDGVEQSLFSEPFTTYLANNQNEIPKLEKLAQDVCTGSWRRYQGRWFILDKKLFLRSLAANPCRESPEQIPLSVFFPDATGPVHAEWYTGKLVVPRGKRVRYVHIGYESEFEQYLVFTVQNGLITAQEESNTKPK